MSQLVQVFCSECKNIPDQYITLICEHNFCLKCLSVMYMQHIQDEQIDEIDEIYLPCNVCNKKTELDQQSIEALQQILQQAIQENLEKDNKTEDEMENHNRKGSRVTKDYPFYQKQQNQSFNQQFYKNQDQKKSNRIISHNSSKDKITMTECLRDSYIQSVDNFKNASNKNKDKSKSRIEINEKIEESKYESNLDENNQEILNQNQQLQRKNYINIDDQHYSKRLIKENQFDQKNYDKYLYQEDDYIQQKSYLLQETESQDQSQMYYRNQDNENRLNYERKKKQIETQLRLIEDPSIILNNLIQKKQDIRAKVDDFKSAVLKNQKELIQLIKEKTEKFINELDKINNQKIQLLDEDIIKQQQFNNIYQQLQLMVKDKYNPQLLQFQSEDFQDFQNQDIQIFKYQPDQNINGQILEFYSKIKNQIISTDIQHQKTNSLNFLNDPIITPQQNYIRDLKESNVYQKDNYFKNIDSSKLYLNSGQKKFDIIDKKDQSPFQMNYKNSQFLDNSKQYSNNSQNIINFNRNDSVKQLNFERKPFSGFLIDSKSNQNPSPFRLNQKNSYLNKFDNLKSNQYIEFSTKKFKF